MRVSTPKKRVLAAQLELRVGVVLVDARREADEARLPPRCMPRQIGRADRCDRTSRSGTHRGTVARDRARPLPARRPRRRLRRAPRPTRPRTRRARSTARRPTPRAPRRRQTPRSALARHRRPRARRPPEREPPKARAQPSPAQSSPAQSSPAQSSGAQPLRASSRGAVRRISDRTYVSRGATISRPARERHGHPKWDSVAACVPSAASCSHTARCS
jgi:hypothetical protein